MQAWTESETQTKCAGFAIARKLQAPSWNCCISSGGGSEQEARPNVYHCGRSEESESRADGVPSIRVEYNNSYSMSHDLRRRNIALRWEELNIERMNLRHKNEMARTGVEPATLALLAPRSNQLS